MKCHLYTETLQLAHSDPEHGGIKCPRNIRIISHNYREFRKINITNWLKWKPIVIIIIIIIIII
jgi:hypothetical protein